MSSYIEVALEKRNNNDSHKAKYNIYEDDNESKEYFAVTNRDEKNNHSRVSRSHNKSDWQTIDYDNDNKTESTEPYGDVKLDNIFSDFEIDVKPMFKNASKSNKSEANPAKAKPAKKSTKKPAKKSVKKGKKGGKK
jgi:hypothetical protein